MLVIKPIIIQDKVINYFREGFMSTLKSQMLEPQATQIISTHWRTSGPSHVFPSDKAKIAIRRFLKRCFLDVSVRPYVR